MEKFHKAILAQYDCASISWNPTEGAYELLSDLGFVVGYVSYDELQCAISDFEEDELAQEMYENYLLDMADDYASREY